MQMISHQDFVMTHKPMPIPLQHLVSILILLHSLVAFPCFSALDQMTRSKLTQPQAPSESRLHALLDHLSPLLRSLPNTDEISKLRRSPILPRLRPQLLFTHLSSALDEAAEPQRSQTLSVPCPDALIGCLSSLLRSPSSADEGIELQQWPR
ncbi:hypothetical protein BDR04DRAFT_338387 [Suillus decipiens]|nr:hypothetical protein BDR04DRAFT_338387 [Suillus decipiens]